MPRRRRLDAELVDQGFFETADAAARCVLAGEVSGRGRRYSSPGEQVLPGTYLHVRGRAHPYVSRGGVKLEHALHTFGVDPEGCVCLDVGASTGGFTDCLLRHGARRVVAVDVGYAQFDWGLRQDARVTLLERTNVTSLPGTGLDGSFDLAVCDVSFTSVRTVLPAVTTLLRRTGTFVTLVKPQYEAAREDVGPGGVVRDERVRRAAVDAVRGTLADANYTVTDSCVSPLAGRRGNVEYLLVGRLG